MHRINKLLKLNQRLFHTKDLALIWGIENDQTLYSLINRYLQKGILISIHKGFYTTVSPEKINPIELGIASLHRFAYLSCESVLEVEGVIFQRGQHLALVSDVSRRFIVGGRPYLCRKLKDQFLFNNLGIIDCDGYKKATLERAAADILYFNPWFYFDNKKLLDWKKITILRKEVFGQ